jgi:hypothetical protein
MKRVRGLANSKGKDWRLHINEPPHNCSVLEEEKNMQILNS